ARAQAGDVRAFESLVEATQERSYALARRILRDDAGARDALQEAYLTAFRRLAELDDAGAFIAWLRRIVTTTALNARRGARTTWLPLDEESAPPVLDAEESRWSAAQQRGLSRALLTLSEDERRLCELHYHGGWTAERLARHAGVPPTTVRKRLQRLRDKLRKEIEMEERSLLGGAAPPADLPVRIAELLARPRLVDLPENPVGAVLAELRAVFHEYREVGLPEQIDLEAAARQLGGDAVYIDRAKLQRIEGERVLRYDLTLPLLLNVRWSGQPSRLLAAGKVYRQELESATHLEAFHQAELFALDVRGAFDVWTFAGRILAAVDQLFPRAEVRVTPTEYPMCRRAWSLDVLREGDWVEVLAWGEYADWVLTGIGADPVRHTGFGAGIGLERFAGLKYRIDDVRKLATAAIS
ncbi:MAG TPA: sigma-70 family RNA polymerase sigma factor, partial [Polyangiaceae bacterium]|nr:sigma-70 family RNA polymerase sigma factor [Polyangiaceae bacterium]